MPGRISNLGKVLPHKEINEDSKHKKMSWGLPFQLKKKKSNQAGKIHKSKMI